MKKTSKLDDWAESTAAAVVKIRDAAEAKGEPEVEEIGVKAIIRETLRVAVLYERASCVRIANGAARSALAAKARAAAAGRDGVASHRQSDAETAKRIAKAIKERMS